MTTIGFDFLKYQKKTIDHHLYKKKHIKEKTKNSEGKSEEKKISLELVGLYKILL